MTNLNWFHDWHPAAEVARETGRLLGARRKQVHFAMSADDWHMLELMAHFSAEIEREHGGDMPEIRFLPEKKCPEFRSQQQLPTLLPDHIPR